MRITILLFLLLSLKCAAQAETVFIVTSPSITASDSVKIDTIGEASISRLMKLPEGYTLISCDVIFSNHYEVFKTHYQRGQKGANNNIMSFLGRTKPKDNVSFEQIVVLKDGRTMRLADKAITIF